MLPLATNFKFNFNLKKKSFSMDTYILFKQNYETILMNK